MDPFRTAKFLWRNIPFRAAVCLRTIQRVLIKYNIFARRPAVKPIVTVQNRNNRLSWARKFGAMGAAI